MKERNAYSIKVLFLCTGNSARSIMAEAILTKLGHPRFLAYSAGSRPTGKVNPLAIELLASLHHSTDGLRSKSWAEFAPGEFSDLDIVITVCDRAAAETCPIWPGLPLKAHWSFQDPTAVKGDHTTRLRAFTNVYQELERCVQSLVEIPPGPVNRSLLKVYLEEIEKNRLTISRN